MTWRHTATAILLTLAAALLGAAGCTRPDEQGGICLGGRTWYGCHYHAPAQTITDGCSGTFTTEPVDGFLWLCWYPMDRAGCENHVLASFDSGGLPIDVQVECYDSGEADGSIARRPQVESGGGC